MKITGTPTNYGFETEGKWLDPSKTPTEGMLGTMSVGSDSYGILVTHVYTPRKIAIACINEDGTVWDSAIYTKRRNGQWQKQGESNRYTGHISFGRAIWYRDPSF